MSEWLCIRFERAAACLSARSVWRMGDEVHVRWLQRKSPCGTCSLWCASEHDHASTAVGTRRVACGSLALLVAYTGGR